MFVTCWPYWIQPCWITLLNPCWLKALDLVVCVNSARVLWWLDSSCSCCFVVVPTLSSRTCAARHRWMWPRRTWSPTYYEETTTDIEDTRRWPWPRPVTTVTSLSQRRLRAVSATVHHRGSHQPPPTAVCIKSTLFTDFYDKIHMHSVIYSVSRYLSVCLTIRCSIKMATSCFVAWRLLSA